MVLLNEKGETMNWGEKTLNSKSAFDIINVRRLSLHVKDSLTRILSAYYPLTELDAGIAVRDSMQELKDRKAINGYGVKYKKDFVTWHKLYPNPLKKTYAFFVYHFIMKIFDIHKTTINPKWYHKFILFDIGKMYLDPDEIISLPYAVFKIPHEVLNVDLTILPTKTVDHIDLNFVID